MTFKFVPPSAEELAARGIVAEKTNEVVEVVEAKEEEAQPVEKPARAPRKKAAAA